MVYLSSQRVSLYNHRFQPHDKLIATTARAGMFISVLHLRMSYKLRMLPANINITSFQSEITETPVLGSETIPPRGDVGKRWGETPVLEGGPCLAGAPQVSMGGTCGLTHLMSE